MPQPFTVRSAAKPANPASGGHFVKVAGAPNTWQQIHAVGPGKWAPGPATKAPAAKAAAPKAAPAANPFSNPLYNPAATLSGKPLYQAVTALTNATYNPELTALKQQIAQGTQQGAAAQKQTAGYFNQLGQYGQQAAQDVQSNNAALNSQLANIGQGTQSALAQQAAAPALQGLEAQGLGAGGTQYLASALAAAQSRAAQNAATDQAYGAKVGANAANLSGQSLGAYALGGQERIGQIAQATRLAQQPLNTQLATDTAKKAAAFSTNLMAARAAERNWGATQAGLNLKAEAFTTPTANAALSAQTSTANSKRTTAQSNLNNLRTTSTSAANTAANIGSRQSIAAQNNATRTAIAQGKAAAKKNQPAPPGAQRTMWNGITKVQGTLRNLVSTIEKWPGATPASAKTQAWHALNTGQLYVPQFDKTGKLTGWAWQKVTPVGDTGVLNAAYNTAFPDSGGLTPGDVSYLHSLGFTIGTRMPIQPAKIGGYTPAQLQQLQQGVAGAVSKLK